MPFDKSVYLEEVTLENTNTYWNVSRWDDDGIVVLASFGEYLEAMSFAMSLDPPEIFKGKRTMLDEIDLKRRVLAGSGEILEAMKHLSVWRE